MPVLVPPQRQRGPEGSGTDVKRVSRALGSRASGVGARSDFGCPHAAPVRDAASASSASPGPCVTMSRMKTARAERCSRPARRGDSLFRLREFPARRVSYFLSAIFTMRPLSATPDIMPPAPHWYSFSETKGWL